MTTKAKIYPNGDPDMSVSLLQSCMWGGAAS